MRKPIVSRRRFAAWMSGLASFPLFAAWKGAAVAQSPPAPLTRIAFGSCADQKHPQPIWDAVLRARPELFIFMGDNVYGDVYAAALTELREAYRVAETVPQLQTLRETVPHLATWDDHDYGVNDGGGDFPYKRQSQALFVETWKLPAGDPRRSREGIYHAEVFGPPGQRVQVILLDPRYFRSPLKQTDQRGAPGKERYVPDDDPAKTMLGEAQWQWLEQQLRIPADLRLVVSSIQFLAEGHGWERWGNLPRERRKLIDLIAATRAGGVVFLSGDRHLSALYEERTGVPYRLVEITSSSLNQPFRNAREAGPNRIGELYWPENFGTAAIDWQARTVALTIHGIDGMPHRQVNIALAELQPR